MIKVENLSKVFKKPIRDKGFVGMFKSLFSRKYQEIPAVKDISFEIPDGQIVGYIGSNGAGKSTTIKMMSGILTPTSGKVLIDGLEPYKKRKQVCQNIGVVFGQKTQLWWDIPLRETFQVLKEVYQVSDEDYKERMEFLGEELAINEFIDQSVMTLSLGQRMRADLACAFLHNPKVLFLDEPTIGLDIWVKDKIISAIKSINAKYHTTVILTTHDMSDIESLCQRVIMIEKGSIIYDGSLNNIKHKFGDVRTIIIPYQECFNEFKFNTFDNKVSFEQDEGSLVIKFNADEIPLENVVDYCFHELHTKDIKINEIDIADVVKSILEENEGKNDKKSKKI